jgi:hypothetical protein
LVGYRVEKASHASVFMALASEAIFALLAGSSFPGVPFDGARNLYGVPAMLTDRRTVRRITATDCRDQQEIHSDDEVPNRRGDRGEPARICKFCRDLERLKAEGFRCVVCDPQELDLIGV